MTKFFEKAYYYFGIFITLILLSLCLPSRDFTHGILFVYYIYLIWKFSILMVKYIVKYKKITEKEVIKDIFLILIPLFIVWSIFHNICGSGDLLIIYASLFGMEIYNMGPGPNDWGNPLSSSGSLSTNNQSNPITHNRVSNMAPNDVVTNMGTKVGPDNVGTVSTSYTVNSSKPATVFRKTAYKGLPNFSHIDILDNDGFNAMEAAVDDFSWCLGHKLTDIGIDFNKIDSLMLYNYVWVVQNNPNIFPQGLDTIITEERLDFLYQARYKNIDKTSFRKIYREHPEWFGDNYNSIIPMVQRREKIQSENSPILTRILEYRKSNDLLRKIDEELNKGS